LGNTAQMPEIFPRPKGNKTPPNAVLRIGGADVSARTDRFEAVALPLLDAAYNLARWLLHDGDKAEDVVQEAYLKAFLYFDSYREGDPPKPWLLGIVRNCCFTWLKQQRQLGTQVEFVDEWDSADESADSMDAASSPEQTLMSKQDIECIDRAIEELPAVFREVVILREMEDLSYEQIARVIDIPVGTVMSRLARARAMLRAKLSSTMRRAG
jgi:RNA polymerase sigma-70 factor (ECF subfamily)